MHPVLASVIHENIYTLLPVTVTCLLQFQSLKAHVVFAALQPRKPEGWEQRFITSSWGWRSHLYRIAQHAWESGVTPGSVIRALGPWGPGLVEKYVTGRFSHHGRLDAIHHNNGVFYVSHWARVTVYSRPMKSVSC